MEQRLAKVTAAAPGFSAALTGVTRQAHVGGETSSGGRTPYWPGWLDSLMWKPLLQNDPQV